MPKSEIPAAKYYQVNANELNQIIRKKISADFSQLSRSVVNNHEQLAISNYSCLRKRKKKKRKNASKLICGVSLEKTTNTLKL